MRLKETRIRHRIRKIIEEERSEVDLGDLAQPLQRILEGKVVGVLKPGPNSDTLLTAQRGHPLLLSLDEGLRGG